MIAHPRQRARRRRIRRGTHEVHQSRSRPERRRIEAAAWRLLAPLTVRGDRRVDQPRVQGSEILPADAEPRARIERRVGDEHVGGPHEAMQDGPTLRAAEVERQPALGAVVDDPPIVVRTVGNAGSARAMAIGVAVGRLELDDVGAEIREDGRGDRPRDEAGAVDDTETVEQEHRRGSISSRRARASARARAAAAGPAGPRRR